MRIAETIGCPLFVIDQFPASELDRWKRKFMLDYYRANPEKLPVLNPEDVSVEESQRQLANYFGVNLDIVKNRNN